MQVVKLLLEMNADPDQAATNGVTPLIIAAQNGHGEVRWDCAWTFSVWQLETANS